MATRRKASAKVETAAARKVREDREAEAVEAVAAEVKARRLAAPEVSGDLAILLRAALRDLQGVEIIQGPQRRGERIELRSGASTSHAEPRQVRLAVAAVQRLARALSTPSPEGWGEVERMVAAVADTATEHGRTRDALRIVEQSTKRGDTAAHVRARLALTDPAFAAATDKEIGAVLATSPAASTRLARLCLDVGALGAERSSGLDDGGTFEKRMRPRLTPKAAETKAKRGRSRPAR